jgi:hypothetical protein
MVDTRTTLAMLVLMMMMVMVSNQVNICTLPDVLAVISSVGTDCSRAATGSFENELASYASQTGISIGRFYHKELAVWCSPTTNTRRAPAGLDVCGARRFGLVGGR